MRAAWRLLLAAACWLLLAGLPAGAAEIGRGPADGFQVRLSAWAEQEVENDLLIATLWIERRGTDSARLAATVAQLMQRALAEAERYPQVKAKTVSYTTRPVYERREGRSQQVGWLIRQQLNLEGTDIAAVTELIGRLQGLEMQLAELRFTVSEPRREAVRAALTAAAIDAWRLKAEAAVRRLGGTVWRPHELTIQDDQPYPVPLMARTAPGPVGEVGAPIVEAGSSRIIITVSGSAWGR